MAEIQPERTVLLSITASLGAALVIAILSHLNRLGGLALMLASAIILSTMGARALAKTRGENVIWLGAKLFLSFSVLVFGVVYIFDLLLD